jgi:hypothetical protein
LKWTACKWLRGEAALGAPGRRQQSPPPQDAAQGLPAVSFSIVKQGKIVFCFSDWNVNVGLEFIE